MPERPPRIIRFESAELTRSEAGDCHGRVVLEHVDRGACVGTARAPCDNHGDIRAVAQAASQAVLAAVGSKGDAMRVLDVMITETFGARTVFVKVAVDYQHAHRELLGFCLVDPDPARAAALALLNATNRFLGVG